MWENKLTLGDLEVNSDKIPQRRIQEENVRYGLAYCKRETKDKSIQKLKTFLLNNPNAEYQSQKSNQCTIQIDDDQSLTFVFPDNKTKADLVAAIYSFFNEK